MFWIINVNYYYDLDSQHDSKFLFGLKNSQLHLTPRHDFLLIRSNVMGAQVTRPLTPKRWNFRNIFQAPDQNRRTWYGNQSTISWDWAKWKNESNAK